jgi:hypothetical protein
VTIFVGRKETPKQRRLMRCRWDGADAASTTKLDATRGKWRTISTLPGIPRPSLLSCLSAGLSDGMK